MSFQSPDELAASRTRMLKWAQDEPRLGFATVLVVNGIDSHPAPYRCHSLAVSSGTYESATWMERLQAYAVELGDCRMSVRYENGACWMELAVYGDVRADDPDLMPRPSAWNVA